MGTVIAVCVSGFSIYQHLVHYTCPNQQRYIIRLLFVCPLYSVTSCLSLIVQQNALYYEVGKQGGGGMLRSLLALMNELAITRHKSHSLVSARFLNPLPSGLL